MTESRSNPLSLERRLRWRLRLARARSLKLETGFTLVAIGILACAAALALRPHWQNLCLTLVGWATHHTAGMMLALMAAAWITDWQMAMRERLRWQHSWLRSFGTDIDLLRNLAPRLAGLALLRSVALAAALAIAAHDAMTPLAMSRSLLCALAPLLPVPLVLWQLQRALRPIAANGALPASMAPTPVDKPQGRIWRWSWRRVSGSWRGRRTALLLLPPMLMVPNDSALSLTLVFVPAVIGLSGWLSGMSLIPQALAFMQPQPVALRRLLLALMPMPLLWLAGNLTAAAIAATRLGASPWMATIASLVVLAVALLHIGCTAHWWKKPQHAQLWFTALLVLLASLLRDLAPLAGPAWALVVAFLLKRSARR